MYVFEHDGKSYGVILPPKCATRSYESALKRIGAKAYSGRHNYPPAVRDRQDILVAAIRHPCDVLVSWYHYDRSGVRSGCTFGEYLGKIWAGTASASSFVAKTTLPGAQYATRYLRYENGPANEFGQFLQSIFHDADPPFEHRGRAQDRHPWRDYYSNDLLGAVREKYKADFKKYGYEAAA